MTSASQTPGEPAELNALFALAQREHRAGRLAEAAAAYRKIIALRPDAAEVHCNLGILLCQQGQFDEALPRFEQALALKPNLADAHNCLGRLFYERGDYQRAANHYECALALKPDLAETCNRLGLIFAQQGMLDQAVARFEQAIAAAPGHAEAYNNLGSVLSRQGKLDQAAARIRQALALKPDFSEAHNNLGTTLAQQNQFAEAAQHYQQAIALQPGNAEAHYNLGSVLWRQEKFDEAAVPIARALALRPNYPEAHNSLGCLLAMQNRLTEAAAEFERALALRPGDLDAHDNLARLRLGQRRFDQAEAHFKQVLSLVPGHAEAEYGLATCYLTQGDFRRGWPAYESRLRLLSLPPQPDLPRWNGEPLAGRRLILIGEQGLGDTLQFLRFARVLKSQGAHVTLAVQPALARLLASHPDLDEVILLGPNMEYPPADFYQFLLSVPGVLGTTVATLPAEISYLSVDAELKEHWRQELSNIAGFKIGIAWEVARNFLPYLRRSAPLAQFAPLARIPGVQLINLQKGAGSEQIAQVDFPVLDFGDRLDAASGPFMDTAAIIANLDLVVSVDTSITHLAGALGAPVFVALHFSNEWRWLWDRDDSPWYPSVRLFRQQTFGRWPDVFERIAQAVRELLPTQGQLEQTPARFEQAIAPRRDSAEAHNSLGSVLEAQGQLESAREQFEQAIALKPNYADALRNLGDVLRQQGKLDQAVARYWQALALRPDLAEVYNNLGGVLLGQGQFDQACAQFEQAVALQPDYAEARSNLGNVLRQHGKLDQARAQLEQAVALKPDYAAAHNNLGNVLNDQGQVDAAAARYQQALALNPDYAEAHTNLGNVLRGQGSLDQAVLRYRQALALRPNLAEAHSNLGNVLKDQGQLDEAAACYRQALALRPDYAKALSNLANVFLSQGRIVEARGRFDRALLLNPELVEGQMGLAACYLVQGDYQRGWPAYEARLRKPGFLTEPALPRWTGQPLAGRRLLLVAEQGLGDTFQFLRYARSLKARGAHVVLAVQAVLGRLLASGTDWDELFLLDCGREPPRTDFYLPLLSAPYALSTDAATIPCEVPYLSADPELADQWRRELAGIDGFKIGVVWQGSRSYAWDRWRSFPLAQLEPLASLRGVRLVSLQKGFGSEQVAAVDFPVLDLSDRLDEAAGPFMDTAAVISHLDLVIAADTSIAHLAGALGAPVWVPLQFSPDWRWLLDRDDSPWYPSVRLFRQQTFGQWPDVFGRIVQAIREGRSEMI